MTYDVVIIGGGHNGLTCAAYLAKAGKSVAIFEARSITGGAAVTEEFHPGFRNSTASYTVSLLNPTVIKDLDLYNHGLKITERAMSNFFPHADGNYLSFPVNEDEKYREFARFSQKDADAITRYEADLELVADALRDQLLITPFNPNGGLKDIIKMAALGLKARKGGGKLQKLLLDMAAKSAVDFLDLYFENEHIKAAYAFDGIVGALASPYDSGTAYVLLHHCFGEVNGKKGVWGHAIGGMGAITDAMRRVAEKHGVKIFTDSPVEKVLVENNQATGIRLKDGRTILARAVAANVSPVVLFRDMVDQHTVDDDFYKRVTGLKCGSGTFRMNVALSELPKFTAVKTMGLSKDTMQPYHTGGIIIGPDLKYLDQAYLDARTKGWSAKPIIEMLIPSTLDDSLAPKGQHVASLFCQHFSYDLPDDISWDDIREQVADQIISTVDRYAPNFSDSVIARQIHTPKDLESKFGLPKGDIFHAQLSLDQLFMARPVLGHADYRMPVKALYLCGSGAHPGGGVTGIPGRNASCEILRDQN